MAFLKNISNIQSTDKELVAAFKESGDPNTLSALYLRYMDLVFGVCLKYFRDAERSKDAVMDIYDELNTKLRNHEVDNFKGWLHVLARNYCLMQLRSPRNLKTTEFNPVFMQSESNEHLDEETRSKEEDISLMEDCMKLLSAEQQQTVELFYMKKKCYNEIAVITGFEWSKVRSHIQNGKRNIKLCMEEKKRKP